MNTLSNVYMTAIERAAPAQAEPLTAINAFQNFSLVTPVEQHDPKHRVVTPYVASYPETPLTAQAVSPGKMEIRFPSTMTATPPLSAGPVDANASKVFSFSATDIAMKSMAQTRGTQPKCSTPTRYNPPHKLSGLGLQLPYTHPRSLHSILRNSPLPPVTVTSPSSPRRQSRRLMEKAAKKVVYDTPLTRDITTNLYTKSHIDLLIEEASPAVSPNVQMQPETVLDLALAFTANEIEDGGQTPGPFEDMRRRMASLNSGSAASSPVGSGGIRKRKRKEKKRRWVWTIGQDDEENEDVGGAVAALRQEAARNNVGGDETKTPITAIPFPYHDEVLTPSIESTDSGFESFDVEMSDTSSVVSEDRGLTPCDMDLDLQTPIAPRQPSRARSAPLRDTPIPPELVAGLRDTPVPPEILPEIM